jgi:hypothetical protein
MWKIAGSANQANWHTPHRLRDLSTRRQRLDQPGTFDYFAVQLHRRTHPEVPGGRCASLLLCISYDIALFMGRLAGLPKRVG